MKNFKIIWPFIISLPHCSSRIPEILRSGFVLNDEEIEESTDMGTEGVFGAIPALNVIRADWSRLVVDLNRGTHQGGPKGIIPQVDYFGRLIYHEDALPDQRERERRLEDYYRPYHAQIKEALQDPKGSVLFDCHALNGIGPPEAPDPGRKRADITLGNNGDRKGGVKPALGETTCPAGVLKQMERAFLGGGFSVSINHPYSGGFITTHYGHQGLSRGKAAVQIEINQDLFAVPGINRVDPEKLEDIRVRILKSFEEIARIF